MRFQLPKPLHGWREFGGEVGVIVLGVLIALGAQQLAESWNWRQKVGVVRKSLLGELANDRARWQVDMAAARCARRDIERLDKWAQAGSSGAPPPAPNIRPNNFFWMHSANWNLATGSQTLDHFPIDEQLAFASLYDGIAHRQRDLERSSEMAERVRTLFPLAVDSEGRRDFRQELGDLKGKLDVLTANDGYMKRHFDALHVKTDRSDFADDLVFAHCVS